MKTFSGYVELVIERFVLDLLLVVLSPRKRFSFGVSALDGVIQSPEFVSGTGRRDLLDLVFSPSALAHELYGRVVV